MPKRQIYFIAGVILVFVFLGFSYLVRNGHFTTFDFNNTVHLQDHISRRFDGIFSFLSVTGQVEVMTIVLAAIFFFTKRLRAGIAAFGFYILFHLIEIFGKYFVWHRPPPEFMVRTLNLVPQTPFYVRTQNSYPSGHAGRTMFVSVILLILLWQNKKWGTGMKLIISCLILAYDVAMVVSRVYLGEHWTSDVIGGTFLGSAFGFFTGMFIHEKISQGAPAHEKKRKGFFPKYKIEVKRVE